jgi:hypothetical protein
MMPQEVYHGQGGQTGTVGNPSLIYFLLRSHTPPILS